MDADHMIAKTHPPAYAASCAGMGVPAALSGQTALPEQTEIKRVAAYIRVSTESDDQENSYELQVRYFTDLIHRTPFWLPAGIYADYGLSGTEGERRTGFRRLLRHCREGRIDHIVCKSVSRFARNTADFLEALNTLKQCNVTIHFEKEGLNTADPCGSFVFTAMGAVAQEESRSLSGNIRKGSRMRFPRGDVPNQAVYGYRFNGDLVTTESGYRFRAIEVVEEEAAIVRRIFSEAADGSSYTEMARRLNREGIPAPENDYTRNRKRHPAMGQLNGDLEEGWTCQVISGIIRMERYTGDVLIQKTWTPDCPGHKKKKNTGELEQYLVKDHHPAIISRDLFQTVQVSADRNRLKHPRKPIRPRPLSGRLLCSCCGRFYRVRNVKHNPIWYCPSTRDYGQELCTAEKIYEEQVLHMIRKAVMERFRFGGNPVRGLKRELESVLDLDHAERDLDCLRRQTESEERGGQERIEQLKYLEEYWRELEKDYDVRCRASAWLDTLPKDAAGIALLLDGITQDYLKAFVLSITVHSPLLYTVHWFDDSITEVRMETNAADHRRSRT